VRALTSTDAPVSTASTGPMTTTWRPTGTIERTKYGRSLW